jgi:hypothetical protein
MKLYELFEDDSTNPGTTSRDPYTVEWNNALMDYVISAKQAKKDKVSIQDIKRLLSSQHFDIPTKNIAMFLSQQKELVDQVNDDEVLLKTKANTDQAKPDKKPEKDKLEKMAQNSAKKNLKNPSPSSTDASSKPNSTSEKSSTDDLPDVSL